MEGPKSRPSFSPLSPSPTPPSPNEAAVLPGGLQSPTAADTPLTRRLKGWDRTGATPTPSAGQGPRESPIGQGESPIRGLDEMTVAPWSPLDPDALASSAAADTKSSPRRVNVAGEAEVSDPRIRHLADSAALSDDDDVVQAMPPAQVNGVSPDTGLQSSNPTWEAVATAMLFNGATAGLNRDESIALLQRPALARGLLGSVTSILAGRGYRDIGTTPDAALRGAADDATAAFLRGRGYTVEQASRQAVRPAPAEAGSPEPPSIDDLQRRLDALSRGDRKG